MIHDMNYYRYYEITEEGFLQKKSPEDKLVKRAEREVKSQENKKNRAGKTPAWIKVGAITTTNSQGKKINGVVVQVENPAYEYHCDASFFCNIDKEIDLNVLKEKIQNSEVLKKYFTSNPKTYDGSHQLNPGDIGGGPEQEKAHADKYFKQFDVDLYKVGGNPVDSEYDPKWKRILYGE